VGSHATRSQRRQNPCLSEVGRRCCSILLVQAISAKIVVMITPDRLVRFSGHLESTVIAVISWFHPSQTQGFQHHLALARLLRCDLSTLFRSCRYCRSPCPSQRHGPPRPHLLPLRRYHPILVRRGLGLLGAGRHHTLKLAVSMPRNQIPDLTWLRSRLESQIRESRSQSLDTHH